jgi:serine/threonine protein phosphatase PrpC
MPEPSVALPAPGLPAGPRSALVIATSTYADSRLRQLRAPARDAAELAGVLADPGLGGFGVTELLDRGVHELRVAVDEFLAHRKPEDTVLVYLSCHGLLDARRRLFFSAADTNKDRLAATGLDARWLIECLDDCRARRQVVILDCCFSGAFARAKGTEDVGLQERFGDGEPGRGRVVLTASRATEYSFEGEAVSATESGGSVFTAALLDGLRTGAADQDHDGLVTVSEAYAYAYARVRSNSSAQTPQRWLYGGEGKDVILSRSPAGVIVEPAEVHEDLRAGLNSRYPQVRIGALQELAAWLTDPNPARVVAARAVMEEVAAEDIPIVAKAARAHLDRHPAAASPRVVPDPPARVVPDRPARPAPDPLPSRVPDPLPSRVPDPPTSVVPDPRSGVAEDLLFSIGRELRKRLAETPAETGQGTLALRYAVRSDIGLVRELNEDSAYAGPRLLAVADGTGGPLASALTIAALAELDLQWSGGELANALIEAIGDANNRLQAMITGQPPIGDTGTTLTAIMWSDGNAAVGHLGNSRGYLLREGELYQITHDHTLVQSLVDEGRIREDEAATHPQRSVLLRLLDGKSVAEPDISVHDSERGDRYLLCSDGLPRVVSDDMLRDILATDADAEVAARELIEQALRGGGPDNITCIVADVVPTAQTWLPPSRIPVLAGAVAVVPSLATDATSASDRTLPYPAIAPDRPIGR